MAASSYVVSANRAGQSAVVNETSTKVYTLAQPAVIQEQSTPPGGSGVGAQGSAWAVVMA